MNQKTVPMTSAQFEKFLGSVPPSADIRRKGLKVTVSAVARATGCPTVVFTAQQTPEGSWDVTGPARLFVAIPV
jgi:hypothetical protein